MSSLTFTQARDEILTLFKAVWDTTGFILVYDDKSANIPSGNNNSWARITVKHVDGYQKSLARVDGQSKYARVGMVMVQIFAESGNGLQSADELSIIAKDAFEGKKSPGGINFERVRLNEIGTDGSWYNVNVIADFEYYEIN